MNSNRFLRTLAVCISVFSLASCGGGGGDAGGPSNIATMSFPLLAGYKASVIAGSSVNYTVSGGCAGTATLVSAPAIPATFEGVTGFSAADSATINLSNCTPSSSTTSGVEYYDANYTPVGTMTTGEEYAKFPVVPNPLPASVRVGDGATVGTLLVYTDSTKAVQTGTRVISYLIEADSPSTAIVNLVSKDYDLSNQLLLTQQNRFRMAADGTLTSISVDLQYSTTSTLHIVLTKS
jgi:hypothetical protein